jgi:hypothetical protein
MLASLGGWGVVSVHWLPDSNGEPVIWLTTRSESERVALEAAPWLAGQVTMLLTRAEVPYPILKRLRILVESEEAHRELLADTD